MSSEVLVHDEPLPAYGEGLLVAEAREEVEEDLDRGHDWPLAFAIFTPVLAAYVAIWYALYVAANALL